MKFREQRGSLSDSMKTCVELKTRAALVEHCRKLLESYSAPEVTNKGIWVQLYSAYPDERIGWKETYMVGLSGYGVLGFTDSPCYESEKPPNAERCRLCMINQR